MTTPTRTPASSTDYVDSLEKQTLAAEVVSYDEFVALHTKSISRKQQQKFASLPQHLSDENKTTNPEWLASRVARVTGSTVGAIYGTNPYSSQGKQLNEMVWPSFEGNDATKYGNTNENKAEKAFEKVMKQRLCDNLVDEFGFALVDIGLENKGLCVCRVSPYYGMSPDGIVVETWQLRRDFDSSSTALAWAQDQTKARDLTSKQAIVASVDVKQTTQSAQSAQSNEVFESGCFTCVITKHKRILVEYKCPYKQRLKTWFDNADVYPMETIKKSTLPNQPVLRLPVPSYYYSQVQYGMHVLGVLDDLLSVPEFCYFVVWHPAYSLEASNPGSGLSTSPNVLQHDSDTGIVQAEGLSGISGISGWSARNKDNTSTTYSNEHGTIQVTPVVYNQSYCTDMMRVIKDFVMDQLFPALYDKTHNQACKPKPKAKPAKKVIVMDDTPEYQAYRSSCAETDEAVVAELTAMGFVVQDAASSKSAAVGSTSKASQPAKPSKTSKPQK